MTHFTKIDDVTNAVNTTPTHAATPTVREAATHPNRQSVGERNGLRIPSADLHARRIAREAEAWIELARERTRMAEPTLVAKALQATAFSVQHRANSFAVPSKLAGTAKHQRALWALVSEPPAPWTKLTAAVQTGGGITVLLGSETLGEVQAKHVPWARPLVAFGLAVHLGRVTGHEREGYRLGCNVVFAHVGAAVAGLRAALDAEAGANGDGAGGRVPTSRIVVTAADSPIAPPSPGGDGGSGPVPVAPRGGDSGEGPAVPVYPGRSALYGAPTTCTSGATPRAARTRACPTSPATARPGWSSGT